MTHYIRSFVASLIFFFSSCFASFAFCASEKVDKVEASIETILIGDGIELTAKRFVAQGKDQIIWIAPDYGMRTSHEKLASKLAGNGIEVWIADFTEALFLIPGSKAMREIKGNQVASLIGAVANKTNKSTYLASEFYGAIPVLYGARSWQISHPKQTLLKGAILFSPTLFASVPSLGVDPEYLPIAKATTVPVYIFQGGADRNRGQLNQLVSLLSAGGSAVYTEVMRDIAGLFFEPERTTASAATFESLPRKIQSAMTILARQPPVRAAKANIDEASEIPTKNLDSALKPFNGKWSPSNITLPDRNGVQFSLDNYRGRITIVNFWATWCPPCVKEIPSLNRLIKQFDADKLRIVSVNYGEPAEKINEFAQQVPIDFPVLIDRDAEISTQWKVIAFPSTYVIGPDAAIHYGVNAAIEWDSAEVIETLRDLLANTSHP